MASDANPVSGRRLIDFLKEHQEPFMLDICLIDYGYTLNGLRFGEVGGRCCFFHKPGRSLSLRKKKKSDSSSLSRFIRHVIGKFLLPGGNSKDCKSERQVHKDDTGRRRKDEEYCGSSSSIAQTTCESFSGSDSDDFFYTKYSAASSCSDPVDAFSNSNVKEKVVYDDSKQLREVPVLERSTCENSTSYFSELENHHNDNPTAHNNVTDESLFFWFMWETVRTIEEKHGFGESELKGISAQASYSAQFVNTKLVLHQTRQLLFDYVKEVVEIQRKKGRNTCFSSSQPCVFPQFLGTEQLARFTCEHIRSCGQTASDTSSTNRLLQSDFSREGRNGWTCFGPETEIVVHQTISHICLSFVSHGYIISRYKRSIYPNLVIRRPKQSGTWGFINLCS